MAFTIGYIIIVIVLIIAMVLILGISYESMKKNYKKKLNNYNTPLIDFCVPPIKEIVWNYSSIPVPEEEDVYSQETANALFEAVTNISSYNCGIIPGNPPEFTNSIFMDKDGIVYGNMYFNTGTVPGQNFKILIVFTNTNQLKNSSELNYEQVYPSEISSSADMRVNKELYDIYINVLKPTIDENATIAKIDGLLTDLMITGHSIGGALSYICALDLFSDPDFKFNSKTHYTFGSPRVGNKTFSENYKSSVHGFRINNTEDIIPQFPLVKTGNNIYEQSGNNIPFTYSYGNVKQNHIDAYKNFMPSCPLNIAECT